MTIVLLHARHAKKRKVEVENSKNKKSWKRDLRYEEDRCELLAVIQTLIKKKNEKNKTELYNDMRNFVLGNRHKEK